ncbi:hypothetical protein C7C56_023245 [Massilia glaciei]|uniref:Uncharacterized protein n=1 Tax=Massilia glaciei TaxID=1524097 RepID=A0A2U2HEM7_9BURK|nr:hypothetical protein C7C56_023245 [Massilia glaciei]
MRDGAARGERCMYITLCKPGAAIAADVAAFGWHTDGIDIVELSPTGDALGEGMGDYQIFPPSEVERVPAWKAVYDAVREMAPRGW